MSAAGEEPGSLTTRDRVRFLSAPESYPGCPEEVEVKETHMSWVFLAGEEVYKLKKPVRYPFLDFSTVTAREENARREVRLNRRLAPDVYYGVVPLTRETSDRLAIGGGGRAVDWLVHMRRLPAACILDVAIGRRTVRPEQIDALAGLLGSFYRRAAPGQLTPAAYVARFEREQKESREVLLHSAIALEADDVAPVFERVDAQLRRLRTNLQARVREGRVVDGHGDLRPEHICLTAPPLVIDCLEFNQELRLVDPFDELAFLGFECVRLGAHWIRRRLIDRCAEILEERPPERLIAFYTAFRALVRARLALAHLLEPDVATPEKWRPRARQYVEIAAKASRFPQAD